MQPDTSGLRRTYTFDEQDYLFGAGPLRMIVEQVDWSTPALHDGENWYEVRGLQVTDDGRPIAPRHVRVRGRRLTPWRQIR